jgi:predicted DNA-binding protein
MEDLIVFSLRIPRRLAKGAEAAARELGLSKSEYTRRAIEELNHRVMQERMAKLSRRLAAASAAAAREMDAASSDGLE